MTQSRSELVPPAETPTPHRRRGGRRIVAAAFLALLTCVLVGRAYLQHRRVQALEAAIVSAGGELMLPAPIWDRMLAQLRGGWGIEGTGLVFDGGTISREWLRQHDNLRPLRITWLILCQCPVDGSELAGFVAAHPIEQFNAWSVPNVDAVAAALSGNASLTIVKLTNSDLTDAGLRQLPLEQLSVLQIAGTHVTSSGLQELRRAHRLRQLGLDGTQLDPEIVDVLSGLPHTPGLLLRGRSVTDERLQVLHGSHLKSVHLQGTSVTKAGVEALRAGSPGCLVEVKP